jgi:tight adherence protein C
MPLQLLLTLLLVFVSVAFIVGALASYGLSWASGDRKRLKALLKPTTNTLVIDNPQLTDRPAEQWQAIIKAMGKTPAELNAIRRRLLRAGYSGLQPAVIFFLSEFITPVVFAAVPLFVLEWRIGVIVAIFAGFVGFMIPGIVLGHLITKRQMAISNGLPDALDLLVLCLEAGGSLDQAIVRATDELELVYPALAEELRTLTAEMRAGKPRLDAFRDFADRTKVDDVRTLVSMLVQTDKFGTSIAQALRTHATVGRTKRRQRAEEKAGRVGVKLVFPLVLCLFPAFFVVILGPAAIKFMRIFSGN